MATGADVIRSKVREFILNEFLEGEDDSRLSDDTALISGGIMDSIGTVRLVTYLEHEFQIALEQRDITVIHFDTVDGITRLIHSKLVATQSG